MDQSKKTMRHFYCRDVLWETFEQMANDFDCSIDYLINEAMRYYARSKNYQSSAIAGGGMPGMHGNPSQPQPQPQPHNAQPHAPYGMNHPGGGGHHQQQQQHQHQVRRGGPPPPPMPGGAAPPPGMGGRRPPPPQQHMGHRGPPPPQQQQQQQQQHGGGGYREQVNSAPTLYLIYNGHRYPVVKDQFIIGRGSKTSDLAIKDGNISRKHAAVIRRNGTYYIKDLGSTNGIDYKGMRIDNKRVDEGDIFHICDYELRFTYRPD